tara:strand:- start:114 stop:365 length:252 start_codon:yes stop_codon:yes gene_type:complete
MFTKPERAFGGKNKINMTTEEYRPLKDLDLNNARNKNESYEDYRKRLKQNSEIIKLYNTLGLDAFKEMFPAGIGEALKNNKKK